LNPKPCSRCEQELPLSAFHAADADFCGDCSEEIIAIVRSKYSAIEAAHFRAQLRRRSRKSLSARRDRRA